MFPKTIVHIAGCKWIFSSILLFLCFASIARGQNEAEVADRISKAGHNVRKDKQGNVEIIGLHLTSDRFIESIDFTVFPRLKRLNDRA